MKGFVIIYNSKRMESEKRNCAFFFSLNKKDYLVESLFEENNITYDIVHLK